jgi:hypothetical protein
MSREILDIVGSEHRQEILITALEQYINRCKGIANSPIKGERVGEKEKKQAWFEKACDAQYLLDDLVIEFN